ncbi:hypothetical protein Moror_2999 [Moniliophthora roreri MCA 2997]|nr:hypothetical protein Moror_2999 [Moniliophthora roreri MCA 2997]
MDTQLSTTTTNNTAPIAESGNASLSPRTLRHVPAMHNLNLSNAEDMIQSEDESSAMDSYLRSYDPDGDDAMDTGTESDRSFNRMYTHHANSSDVSISSVPASPLETKYPYPCAVIYEGCGGEKLEGYEYHEQDRPVARFGFASKTSFCCESCRSRSSSMSSLCSLSYSADCSDMEVDEAN